MVASQYFNGRMTAEEMKKEYRRLALLWHPDVNKSENATKVMQAINAEYAYWYSRAATSQVKEEKKQNNPDKTEYYESHYDRVFIQSLEEMIRWIYNNDIDRIPNVTVELIEVFIWIGGISWDMKDAQAKVRSVGFQGSWKIENDDRVYMWKWTPLIRRFGAEEDINKIRSRYGTSNVNRRGGNGRKQIA